MINCTLILQNGTYINDDAIENLIHYIGKLDSPYQFCYGAWLPTKENIISIFNQTRLHFPDNKIDKQVQHLIFSFGKCHDIALINTFSNQIAMYLAQQYPVYFALHDDSNHLHTHFAISTTSHIPNIPPLTNKKLHSFFPDFIHIALTNKIILKDIIRK